MARLKRWEYFPPALFILITAFSLALLLSSILLGSGRFGAFGTSDFVQYWSAFKLLQQGINPYSAPAMLEAQRGLGLTLDKPVMMWNPPWLPVLLSPVLSMPFQIAAQAWAFLGVGLSLLGGVSVWGELSKDRDDLPLMFALVATFFPIYRSIASGQMGCVLFFAAALFLRGMNRRESLLAGTGLFLMSIKPHIFYLVFIATLFDSCRRRDFRHVFVAVSMLGAAVLLTQLVAPSALDAWSKSFGRSATDEYVSVHHWQVVTLVGLVRSILAELGNGLAPIAPAVVIPAFGAMLYSIILVRSRGLLNWNKTLPPLLFFSYLTSPYGWVADQAILCLPYLAIGFTSFRVGKAGQFVSAAIALQAAAFLCWGTVFTFEHQFIWYPLVLLALYAASPRDSLRASPRAEVLHRF